MKKVIVMVLSLVGGELMTESSYLLTFQEKREVVCSVCGRSLIDEDFLYLTRNDSPPHSLLCRVCAKKVRGKGKKGEKGQELVSYQGPAAAHLFFGPSESDTSTPAQERFPSMIVLAKAGRRRRMVVLREARTGVERKDKDLLRKLMEEEAEVAQEHTWNYRVVDDHTVEAQNTMRKIQCVVPAPLSQIWYKGSCLVLVSEKGYEVHDFYSDETERFSLEEYNQLTQHLGRYGHSFDFAVHEFSARDSGEGSKAPKVSLKSALMSPEKRERIRQKELKREEEYKKKEHTLGKLSRLIFSDETGSSVSLAESRFKFPFHYAREGEKTLLVGNAHGYILKWPVGLPIADVFARDTQAVIVTQEKGETKQLWHDFARHNEEGMVLAENYPLAVLEAPLQTKEQLEAQGFVSFPVPEKTFDTMFHEMAVIPLGFSHRFHSIATLEELVEKLKCEEGRSVGRENDTYRCSLDPRRTKMDVLLPSEDGDDDEDEADGFEITINNPQDRIWKRGAEVLLPDNGRLVLYDFERERVERFAIPAFDSLEKELAKLEFTEIK
jgi:hypothetical protein